MKKYLSLFFLLAVVSYGCQEEELDLQDAASKANASKVELPAAYAPAAGTTVNCVDIYDLTAGQHIKAGTVEVSNDGSSIHVTYKTTGGWYLLETHTYAGSFSAVPRANGAPIPGQFPDKSGDITGATTYTASFAYEGADYCVEAILAHASVANGAGQQETAWGGDIGGHENRWFYYISNYCVRECETEDLHLRTQTIGGWGAPAHGNNPGAYLHANYSYLTQDGRFTVGIGRQITFSSAQAITNYLPDGGPAKALAKNETDPKSLKNVFASQVVALKISVTFDNAIDDFGVSEFKLANAKVTSGPYIGYTVAQVLNMAEVALGGGMGNITSLNAVVSQINESFVDGKITEKSAILTK